jgi:predicted small lipoprotein YifL
MKRVFTFTGLAATVLIVLAGCGGKIMLYQNEIPTFKAPDDKALCVVIRPTRYAGGDNSIIWLDQKAVAGTLGNSITSFTVDPGEHMVITKLDLSFMKQMIKIPAKVKFNFQPGKLYFLFQTLYPLPGVGVCTSLTPLTRQEAMETIEKEKGNCKYGLKDPNYETEDYSEKDIKEFFELWNEWAKKEPEKAKVEIEYPGY